MSSKKQSFSTVNRDSRAERFANTIERLGFENVEQQLMGDELLERKAEILGEK